MDINSGYADKANKLRPIDFRYRFIYGGIVVEQQIIDFIHRRFLKDCEWMNGNCYFFAQILASRFMGEIVYDPIEGHFLFYAYDENFYDWSGRRDYTDEYKANFVLWENYSLRDPLHRSHIWRDCVK